MSFLHLERFCLNYISFNDVTFLREICPKLKYLQIRTDYQDAKLDILACTEEINQSVMYLCLILDRWIGAKLNVKRIENLLSYFPNVATLKIDKRHMSAEEVEWNALVLQAGLHIVNISAECRYINSIH